MPLTMRPGCGHPHASASRCGADGMQTACMFQPHKIMLSGMHSVRMLGRLHAAAGTAHGVRTWWGYKQRCPARDSDSLPACRCCGAAVH